MIRLGMRVLSPLTLGTLIGVAPIGVPATATPLPATADGPIVALNARGGMGEPAPGTAAILAIGVDSTVHVVARERAYPYIGGIAPSPRGRFVAYSEDAPFGPTQQAGTDGLYVVSSAGGPPRRVLAAPASAQGNRLSIGAVAWSPDRYTVAYAVSIAGRGVANPQQERALGIWLARYDTGRAHEIATDAQVGAAPSSIARLAWSPDGRRLIVSTSVERRGGPTPAVLSVDPFSGHAAPLVVDGQDADVSPATGALAYTVSTARGTTLWIADARGRHPHALLNGPVSSPTWAPDGREIAYIATIPAPAGRPPITVIRAVDSATGRVRTILSADQPGVARLVADGQFVRLAWMHARL